MKLFGFTLIKTKELNKLKKAESFYKTANVILEENNYRLNTLLKLAHPLRRRP